MCQACDCHSEPPPRQPSCVMSRRSFLALSGVASGALATLWSCRSEEVKPSTQPRPATAPTSAPSSRPSPATTRAGTTTAASQPATAAAQTSPAPDLGAAVFPDASGRPIAAASDAPVIILPRSDWTTLRPNLAQIQVMGGVDKITVHHTAAAVQTDAWKSTANELENIRGFHAGTKATDRNWADIAYHFVVDRAGRVWQARPLAYQGAHVRGHNEHNLGIVLLGNFESQNPAAAQLWSLANFIPFLRTLYNVPLAQVFTHGELGMTSCPGKNLQSYMNRTRRTWAADANVPWAPASQPTTSPATDLTLAP